MDEQTTKRAVFACQMGSNQLCLLGSTQQAGKCQRHGYACLTHRRDQNEMRNRHDGGDPTPTDAPWPHGDRHEQPRRYLQRIGRVPASKVRRELLTFLLGASVDFSEPPELVPVQGLEN